MHRFVILSLLLTIPTFVHAQAAPTAPPPDIATQALNSMIMDQTSREVEFRKMLIEANQKLAEQQKQIDALKAAAAAKEGQEPQK